jgi:hypothetical protein
MIQPQIFTTLCIVTWAQSLYYPPVQVSKRKLYALIGLFVLVGIALEAGFIIPCRNAYDKGISWPSLIFGIIASILLAVGLVPPYFELAKRRGRVVGINFVFLSLDFSGAFFSALSLAFAREFDVMGIVLYSIVGAMELGIFTSHLIWWIRFGRHEKNEEEEDEESKDGESEQEDLTTAPTTIDGLDQLNEKNPEGVDLAAERTLVLDDKDMV